MLFYWAKMLAFQNKIPNPIFDKLWLKNKSSQETHFSFMCPCLCLQGEGRLRPADRGGRHDDHGPQAGPHVRLHLRPVPLQPPAQV